jgi:hypothetical protein
MTPRTDIDWIDIRCTGPEIRAALSETDAQPAAGSRWLGRQYRRRCRDARNMLTAMLDGEEPRPSALTRMRR